MSERISIVIIGRNEESTIRLCAEAALRAAKQVGGAEMIYVDSHSTDRTVAVMEDLGFKVLYLDPGMRRSPSAGRSVGSKAAHGELILFLDADTLIYEDFLPAALARFAEDQSLGGYNGRIDDFTEAGKEVIGVEELYDKEVDVKWLRGPCCLYRRKALLRSGSFDPDLAMEEEAELGLRIIQNGWRLKWSPVPMARHTRCYHGDSLTAILDTFKRDHRAKRLGEITRTISHAFLAGNGLAFCWLRLKTTILFTAWLMLICGSFLIPTPISSFWTGVGLITIGLTAIGIKKGSAYQALIFAPSKILNILDILLGLHKIKFRLSRPSTQAAISDN